MAKLGKPGQLSERQARFAREYVKDFNASQAAIRSGYSAKTARGIGSRLLTYENVQTAIQSLAAKAAVKQGITIDRVNQELARLAFSDPRKLFHEGGRAKLPNEWDDDTAAAVSGIETDEVFLKKGEAEDGSPEFLEKVTTRKIKQWDKVRALAQCVQILGMAKTPEAGATSSLAITIIPYSGK